MQTLTPTAIQEKNKLASESAELVLAQVDIEGENPLRFALDPGKEKRGSGETLERFVTWREMEWVATAFDVGNLSDPKAGEYAGVEFKISNVDRKVMSYLEISDGAVGSQVTLYAVNSNLLDEEEPLYETSYTVLKTSVDEEWAIFTLGAPNHFRRRFPLPRVMNNFCRYNLTEQCRFVGSCNRTLTACRTKAACSAEDEDWGQYRDGQPRTVIFGGFPGAGRSELNA